MILPKFWVLNKNKKIMTAATEKHTTIYFRKFVTDIKYMGLI